MHIVFSCTNGGSLWLGGIGASGQAKVLVNNGVSAILAGAAKLPPARDPLIADLGTFDGTGLINGTVSLKALLARFKKILELLMQGKGILISCRNGAHRSSTIMVLLLIWFTGESAQVLSEYLWVCRNIVDLQSFHPGAVRRGEVVESTTLTPLDWLKIVEPEVLADRKKCEHAFLKTLELNEVLERSEWEERALSMGFQKHEEMHGFLFSCVTGTVLTLDFFLLLFIF